MKQRKQFIGIVAAVVVVAAIFAVAHLATKPSSDTMQPTSTAATMTNKVTIHDYMFSPAVTRVTVGTTVTWTNSDSVNHTVTADTNSTDAPSSMDIAQGKSFSFTFKKAGTYTYHCFPHPYMHGTVEVINS
jgi:plastocyanin